MDGEVESAMQTPDGVWRVEVVRRGRSRWYRVVNDSRDVELDWPTSQHAADRGHELPRVHTPLLPLTMRVGSAQPGRR
jgi:hypothetical protein